MHSNIYKIYNIYIYIYIYTRNTRRRLPGPAPSRPGRTGARDSGPGRAAAARYFAHMLYILFISVCIWIYLDILWYFLGDVTVYFLLEICTKTNEMTQGHILQLGTYLRC